MVDYEIYTVCVNNIILMPSCWSGAGWFNALLLMSQQVVGKKSSIIDSLCGDGNLPKVCNPSTSDKKIRKIYLQRKGQMYHSVLYHDIE